MTKTLPVFAERCGEIAVAARRGGIMVPGVGLSAPLDVVMINPSSQGFGRT